MGFHRSMLIKVIDICSNRMRIYDFLLVINYDLSCILHYFLDVEVEEKSKTTHNNWAPDWQDPFEFKRTRLSWHLQYFLVKTAWF